MTNKSLERRVTWLESGSGEQEFSLDRDGETFVLTLQALRKLLKEIDGADCGLSPRRPADP